MISRLVIATVVVMGACGFIFYGKKPVVTPSLPSVCNIQVMGNGNLFLLSGGNLFVQQGC